MPIHSRFLPGLLAVLLSCQAPAQSVFPTLEGETTDGTTITLPLRDTQGFSVVAVALGKKAEPLLERWYAPAYNRFVAKNGLFAGSYEVELFLVPVFTGLNRSAYGPTMNRLRKEVDPEIARRVVFFKGDAGPLVDALGMKDKDIPYFFVLDPQGRIIGRASGDFSVDRLDALEAPMLQ